MQNKKNTTKKVVMHLLLIVTATSAILSSYCANVTATSREIEISVKEGEDVMADMKSDEKKENNIIKCSENLMETKIIGKEGGVIVLPPVKLMIQEGSLSRETRIILRRHPVKKSGPRSCDVQDLYTAEPFLLKTVNERPFQLLWTIPRHAKDEKEKKKRKNLCAMVSWTRNGDLKYCYSRAGLPKFYQVDYKNKWGTISYKELNTGCIDGCGVKRLSKMNRDKIVRKIFISDRLSHFRLLNPDKLWNKVKLENEMRKNNSENAKEENGEEVCTHVPGSDKRDVYFEESELNNDMYWNITCNTDGDCLKLRRAISGAFSWCEKRIGHCNETGVCTIERSESDCADEMDIAVCGCDGRTYKSRCYARMSKVSVRYKGQCREKEEENVFKNRPQLVPVSKPCFFDGKRPTHVGLARARARDPSRAEGRKKPWWMTLLTAHAGTVSPPPGSRPLSARCP